MNGGKAGVRDACWHKVIVVGRAGGEDCHCGEQHLGGRHVKKRSDSLD